MNIRFYLIKGTCEDLSLIFSQGLRLLLIGYVCGGNNVFTFFINTVEIVIILIDC
jgi:hypothetical protein